MFELGMFQQHIIPSIPPLKHDSPVGLIAKLSTAPSCARKVYTGSTSKDAVLHIIYKLSSLHYNLTKLNKQQPN